MDYSYRSGADSEGKRGASRLSQYTACRGECKKQRGSWRKGRGRAVGWNGRERSIRRHILGSVEPPKTVFMTRATALTKHVLERPKFV